MSKGEGSKNTLPLRLPMSFSVNVGSGGNIWEMKFATKVKGLSPRSPSILLDRSKKKETRGGSGEDCCVGKDIKRVSRDVSASRVVAQNVCAVWTSTIRGERCVDVPKTSV